MDTYPTLVIVGIVREKGCFNSDLEKNLEKTTRTKLCQLWTQKYIEKNKKMKCTTF